MGRKHNLPIEELHIDEWKNLSEDFLNKKWRDLEETKLNKILFTIQR